MQWCLYLAYPIYFVSIKLAISFGIESHAYDVSIFQNYSRQNHDTRINKSFFDILGIHLHYKLLISNYIDINYKMFDPSCDEILKDLCGSGNTQNNDTTTGLEFVPNNSLPTN
ncbi:unnamed protein product [Rotaria magnacalcarata]